MAPLITLAGEALGRWFDFDRDTDRPTRWDGLKLLHATDLQQMRRFPRCQDYEGTTYGEYRAEVRQLRQLRKKVRRLLEARSRLEECESDRVVVGRTEQVAIPRSVLRREVRVPLDESPLPGTWRESSDGNIANFQGRENLMAKAGWRRHIATVRTLGPSRVVHAEKIAELRRELGQMDDSERQAVDDVTTSRFGHPVLFISHRWESADHPDPTGKQLDRLRQLRNCWIIYDYSSFPQLPRSDSDEAEFEQILGSMDKLIENVVILASPDHLSRGWLVFEYLIGAFQGTIVCDEVDEPSFRALQDWCATHAPLPANPFRDSWESQQINFINQKRLEAVNNVLPIYRSAKFRTEHDSSAVTSLLAQYLKDGLPPRKEHHRGVGEWGTVPWSDADIAQAFRGEVPIPHDIALEVSPFKVDVPNTLGDAVSKNYAVKSMTLADRADPFHGFLR